MPDSIYRAEINVEAAYIAIGGTSGLFLLERIILFRLAVPKMRRLTLSIVAEAEPEMA
ncbi:MAG: hypothetical protein WB696_12405 [Chthoniobacterales bacterium]